MKKRNDSTYTYVEPEKTPEDKTLSFIIDGFDNLLKRTDKDYKEKIFFNVSYKHYNEFNKSGEYYKISIFSVTEGFNSQKYFKKKFEEKKSLAKFAEDNNIGLITY